MNFFWIWSGKRLKRYFIAVVALLFALGIYYADHQHIQVFLPFDSGPSAVYSVDTQKKEIALTFDISWGRREPVPFWMYWNKKG